MAVDVDTTVLEAPETKAEDVQSDSSELSDVQSQTATPEEQEAQAVSERDAQARAVFEKIADKHETTQGDSPAKEAAKTDEPGAKDREVVEGEKAAESAKESELPDGADDAITAAKRYGMSEEAIVAWLERDSADFVAYGQKLVGIQKDIDTKLSARGQQPNDANQEPAEQAQADQPTIEPPKDFLEATKVAVDEVLEPLADDVEFAELKPLLGILSTKLAEQLTSYADGRLATIEADFTAKVTDLTEYQNLLTEEWEQGQLETARQGMMEKYPDLAKDDYFREICDGPYRKMVKTGEYRDVSSAFKDAMKLHSADDNPADTVKRIKETLYNKAQQQLRGQVRPKAPKVDERKLTVKEQAWQRFNKIADRYEGPLTK